MGPPMGPLFPEKNVRAFATKKIIRLHDRGGPMGPPHGALFPEKKIRGFATKNFFRLHDRGGPMGPQIYDLYVLYT